MPGSPWAETVARLRCLRGIDTLSAVGLCAEVGDFERFERAARLMSYLGLVPSEDSSGERRRQGRSPRPARGTRAGCWSRRPGTTAAAGPGQALTRRQHGQPAHVLAICWQRPAAPAPRLAAPRPRARQAPHVVAVAVARELAGFCWALARADSDRPSHAPRRSGGGGNPGHHAREHPAPGATLDKQDRGLSRRKPVLRQPTAYKSLTARRAPAGPAATSTDTGCPPQPRASGCARLTKHLHKREGAGRAGGASRRHRSRRLAPARVACRRDTDRYGLDIDRHPEADPVIRDRFAPVTAPCTRGVCPLTSAMPGSARHPPRTRQLDRAMMFEKGHNRRRSTTHDLPTVSVARNSTVSLHPVARASSPVTPAARATKRSIPRPALSLDACCLPQHGAHRRHAGLRANRRIRGSAGAGAQL